MDPIFQTLLFSTSKGEGEGDSSTTTIPRPSRYAQLIPREALRLNPEEYGKKQKHKKGNQSLASNDEFQTSNENNVDVYRMDESGELELIPREEYDVVYEEGEEDDGNKSDTKADDNTTSDKAEVDEAMDVEAEGDATNVGTQDEVLYIVQKDPQLSMHQGTSHEDDDASTSDSTKSGAPAHLSYKIDNPLNRKISVETSMAQTLTRVLVQRTEGYESIRRNFGLDEEEEAERMKRKKNKKKPSAGGLSGASGKCKKDNKQAKNEGNDEDEEQVERKGHRLLSHLVSSTGTITDGDEPKTLERLSRMRMWQEEHIAPEMMGVNLENWEDQIDWEGGVSSDEEKEESKTTAEKLERMPQQQLYSDDPIQILYEPRNPRLDALDLCAAVNWEGACSDSEEEYERPNIPLILTSSMAGKSVASLFAPLASSRPLPFEAHPNYQQRYDSELSSEMTAAELQSNIPGGKEALEKYKEMRQRKREQMAKDKQSRVTEVMSSLSLSGTGRRITSSLMGPGGAERTGRPSRHNMGSSTHDAEYVEQLEFVYNHNITKPELSLSEYRQFHRPRLPLAVVTPACQWIFQSRVIAKSKKSRGITAADGSTMIGSYHSMMAGSKAQSKIKNEADLSPSMGDYVIMEYSEERPPLPLTKGMTCRIVNYYRGDRARCPVSAGGGDRPLRKRHGEKAAVGKEQGTTGPSGKIERPPRLLGPNEYKLESAADLIGVISSSKKKKSKEVAALEAKKAKDKAIDVLPEGVTEILHPKVHGPFIGEVEEGNTITGLISNLFSASMFRHESEPTDFLMVLGQASTNESGPGFTELGVVLRPFPSNIYCVGQTEPRVKVFSPGSNEEKRFVNAFIEYHCANQIRLKQDVEGTGLTFDEIKKGLFSKVPTTQLRMRLKQVANFDRSDEGAWTLKRLGQDGFPGVDALGRKVSPEGIAAHESELAAIQRLQDLGLKELFIGANSIANIAVVMIYLNGLVQSALERKIRMKKLSDIKKRQKSPLLIYFEKAYQKLEQQHKEVKKRQEIAKFVYQELQLAPWNLTGDFIDVHKRNQGSAMMKLTGIGDPSGVGEAFNLLREDERKPNKALLSQSDGALNAQIKKITGTANDLRKLTMKQMASLLRSYGMKDTQIKVLKRWDRVHVIRDLSTKAASDGMGDEMERFARGEKVRLSDQRENYKKRVQEIWHRQIAALSSSDTLTDVPVKPDDGLREKNTHEADTDDISKEKQSDDEDDDDDDFAAMMEMEMTSTGEANRLLSAQLGDSSRMRNLGGSIEAQELSKEARELATFQRQREEERAMQSGLEQKVKGIQSDKKSKYQKVIRRKVIKTNLDGSQTIAFEFIVDKHKVDEHIAKLRSKPHEDTKKTKRGKNNVLESDDEAADTCVGHALWEDEDKVKKKANTKLGLKMRKQTKMGRGPKKSTLSKISIAKASEDKTEQRKRKREKAKEEKEQYKAHHRTGTSNRKERGAARDRMPHVILSDRLEQIRAAVESRPTAGAFHKPVSRDHYPAYYEVINDPIDLQTIREKNRKYDYKKADAFVKDFELMKRNAINFNGKGTALANEATEIFDFVKRTIEQNRDEFTQMEQAVHDQINGRRKKKPKASKENANDTGAVPAMNTASIVVDGVQTQVNLGTNLSFGFGGDDSDSSGDV